MKALVLDGSREGDSLTPVAVQGMTAALYVVITNGNYRGLS